MGLNYYPLDFAAKYSQKCRQGGEVQLSGLSLGIITRQPPTKFHLTFYSGATPRLSPIAANICVLPRNMPRPR